MAQPQRQADVHQDELCPPNKRYAFMDANEKKDLDNLLCPNESKIVANILQNHPLRFNIHASSSVPWIYLGQFWHTLKEDGSKYRLKFVDEYAEIGLLWSLSVFIRSIMIQERVHDFQLGVESYQQKVNLTAPTITFPGIEKYKVFSIVSEPVYGIIYKNNKKEKRVMRHQEVHKFCDATLKRVLEGLKSYNNNIKHRYVTPSLSNEDTEYLQLFEEEIEERLKHRDQMRRWDMYVNRRPLGSRRERPK
ncbi:hypothetical protein Tco_0281882 [Tanacetum coccineum]